MTAAEQGETPEQRIERALMYVNAHKSFTAWVGHRCEDTATISQDDLRSVLAQLARLRADKRALSKALEKAAGNLDSAARGIDDDHPMHKHFIKAADSARIILGKHGEKS